MKLIFCFSQSKSMIDLHSEPALYLGLPQCPFITIPLRFFLLLGQRANHRKCVICDSGCHWLLCRNGRVNKSPLNASWLPSTQMMDSSWRGIMEGSEGFVFVLNFIAFSHTCMCVCVYAIQSTNISRLCAVNSSTSR